MITRDLHPIHQTEDGFFNVHSGRKINLHRPTVDMIDIDDIATALSKICRFGGHTGQFYSVAQHSCLVSMLAPRDLQRAALLHDAAEAYLGDVIKPLKVIIGDIYMNLEDAFEILICEKFNITGEQLREVKYFDKRAVEIEYNYFFKGTDELVRIFGEETCWNHEMAKDLFLYNFKEVRHA